MMKGEWLMLLLFFDYVIGFSKVLQAVRPAAVP